MLASDRAVEVIDLDLVFLEGEVGEEDDGGVVRFGVKELLVDIRHSIADLGRANKEDLASLEVRLTEKITAHEKRIEGIENKVDDLRISRAQLYGVCVGLSLAAGGISGLLAKALA